MKVQWQVNIASTMAAMGVLSYMERRFIAEAHADFAEKLAVGELETEAKQ